MINNESCKIRQKLREICTHTTKFPVTAVSVLISWYLFKSELGINLTYAKHNLEPYSVFNHLMLHQCHDKKIESEINDLYFFHKHNYVKKSGRGSEQEADEDEDEAGEVSNIDYFDEEDNNYDKILLSPRDRIYAKDPESEDEFEIICQNKNKYTTNKECQTQTSFSKRKRQREECTDDYEDDDNNQSKRRKKKSDKKVTEGEMRYVSCVARISEWFKRNKTIDKCKHSYDVTNSLQVDCLYANSGDMSIAISTKSLPVDTRDLISRKSLDKNGIKYDEFVKDDTLYGAGQIGVKRFLLGGVDLTTVPILDDEDEDEDESSDYDTTTTSTSIATSACTTFNNNDFMTMFAIEESNAEVITEEQREENEFQRNKVIDQEQFQVHHALMKVSNTIYKLHKMMCNVSNTGEFDKINMITGETCLSCSLLIIYQFRVALFDLVNKARAHMLKVQINDPTQPHHRIFDLPINRQRDPETGKFVQSELKPFVYERDYKPTLKQIVDCVRRGVNMLGSKAVKIVSYREETCENGEVDDNDYTYDFMGEEISESCFDRAYMDWRESFPFFPKLTEEEQKEMFNHLVPPSSSKIWCYTNPRLSSIETNIHKNTNQCCSLPVKVRLVELLCKVNKKPITVLKNGVVELTNRHGMKYSLDMMRTFF